MQHTTNKEKKLTDNGQVREFCGIFLNSLSLFPGSSVNLENFPRKIGFTLRNMKVNFDWFIQKFIKHDPQLVVFGFIIFSILIRVGYAYHLINGGSTRDLQEIPQGTKKSKGERKKRKKRERSVSLFNFDCAPVYVHVCMKMCFSSTTPTHLLKLSRSAPA